MNSSLDDLFQVGEKLLGSAPQKHTFLDHDTLCPDATQDYRVGKIPLQSSAGLGLAEERFHSQPFHALRMKNKAGRMRLRLCTRLAANEHRKTGSGRTFALLQCSKIMSRDMGLIGLLQYLPLA